MKIKKSRLCIFSVACLLIICTCLNCTSSDYIAHIDSRSTFGYLVYGTLKYPSSNYERYLIKDIMYNIEDALSYSGSEIESTIRKPYVKLCNYPDPYGYMRYSKVDLDVRFITAKIFFNRGYVWFEYSVDRYLPGTSIPVNGATNILCLIKIKKSCGKWVAEELIQEP